MVPWIKNILTSLTTWRHPTTSKSEQLFKQFESLSNDTIYRLRYEDMSYDYISPEIIKLIGYSAEEMQKINLRSIIIETRLISRGMRSVYRFENLEQDRKERKTHKWEADYLIKKKDGSLIWISDISYPWCDPKGKIIGSIGCLRNLSDRVAAEELVRQELTKIAHMDPLTRLANRREFFKQAEYELKRFERTQSDVSILLVNVDGIKEINKQYGYDVGDTILSEIAKLIQSTLRDTDLPARLGGRQFGILLPDTKSASAYWVAERLRNTVSKHIFYADRPQKEPVECTVSIGVGSTDLDHSNDIAELYKLADTRLYIAQHTGENRVSLDDLAIIH